LPVSPRVGTVFITNNFSDAATLTKRPVITAVSDGTVRNQNTLVIQKAERLVVASKEEQLIFTIAAKRKKSRGRA
jgi:hypothetical protein